MANLPLAEGQKYEGGAFPSGSGSIYVVGYGGRPGSADFEPVFSYFYPDVRSGDGSGCGDKATVFYTDISVPMTKARDYRPYVYWYCDIVSNNAENNAKYKGIAYVDPNYVPTENGNTKTVTRKTYSFSMGGTGTSSYVSYENACHKFRPGAEFHNNGDYLWTCGGSAIDAGSPHTATETITMPMQSTTNEVVDYILSVERFEANAYLPTPNDRWTVGYGSTFYADGSPVRQGDTITRDAASILFRDTLRKTENDINKKVTVYLNDNQFSALVSFLYNVGIGNFSSSTLLQKLNNLDYKGAADEFPRWNKQNGAVLNGLTIRRAHEQSIFNK